MRVLLEHCFNHWSSRWLYRNVAFGLRLRGFEVDVRQTAARGSLDAYDFFLSHDFVDDRDRQRPRVRCWGGRLLSRPQTLDLVRAAGIPVMAWARAADRAGAAELFEQWGVGRLLLKRSGTMKSRGVVLFDRTHLSQLEWNPDDDVFCPEIDPTDGTVYKAEIINGHIILTWSWNRPPLSRDFAGTPVGAGTTLHSPRGLFELPADLADRVRHLSSTMTDHGVGHCSLDLMKTPGGELLAIELNTGQVASWWTARFPRFHWRYASAVAALLAGPTRPPARQPEDVH